MKTSNTGSDVVHCVPKVITILLEFDICDNLLGNSHLRIIFLSIFWSRESALCVDTSSMRVDYDEINIFSWVFKQCVRTSLWTLIPFQRSSVTKIKIQMNALNHWSKISSAQTGTFVFQRFCLRKSYTTSLSVIFE